MENFSTRDLIQKGLSGTPTDQKVGKFIMGAVVIGLLLVGLYYVLPYLVPIFQNIESIASFALRTLIYVLIGFVIIAIARKQVRNLEYLSEHLSRLAFKGIITYDPFLIQEKQILQAEKDVDKMLDEEKVIDGKYIELSTKLNSYNERFQIAGSSIGELKKELKLANDALPMSVGQQQVDLTKRLNMITLSINDKIGEQNSCKKYIDSISPIANNMKFMKEFITDGSQILKKRISGAKRDLEINKDIFESAHAGADALDRMKKAMVGDIELNNDAEKAQMEVMKNIALTVGQMRVSMEIISDVTRTANIEEGGRLALARKQLESLNLQDGDAYIMSQNTANFQDMSTLKQVQILNVGNQMPD